MKLALDRLRCEYANDPIGIDVRRPRLSWTLVSQRRGTHQAGYRIQVARDRRDLLAEERLLWDSGEVASDRSQHVEYSGPALHSFDRCWWRVRASDTRGEQSGWSGPASWEMGVLDCADWHGEWITPELPLQETDNPCPLLRREFSVSADVAFARLYITSLGLYEAEINGLRVGDARFTPGFTSFHHRLQYQVHDVTSHLRTGPNAMGVVLADGWYRGHLWVCDVPNVYGRELALLLQLRVVYASGREQWITSDPEWRCSTGPWLSSDLYFGEVYDARCEQPGWSSPGFDAGGWHGVRPCDAGTSRIVASSAPPVRLIEEIPVQRIFTTPRGERIADLGQNIAGSLRVEARGERGREITLSCCEVLTPEGNFSPDQLDLLGYQRRAGRWYQVDRYVLKGEGVEVFEPRFTFHGYRYVKIDAPGVDVAEDRLRGLVLHSDLEETGEFSCSHPGIDQLQHNIRWSQKGNFLEVPSDCPQREKMGWTGDIQIYAPTACFLMESAGFLGKWLQDLAADQHENGLVPHVIPWPPDYPMFKIVGTGGSSGWGDACTVVPTTLHLYYGDERILAEMYPVMKRWLAFIESRASGRIWRRRMHWGDWLEPGRSTIYYHLPWAPKGYVATPFWAHSAELTARTARILGHDDEAAGFEALAREVKEAYLRQYVRADGRIRPSRQGAYVLALAFDMVPEPMRPRLAGHLADLVRANGCHLDTGFLSTVHLCDVLCRFGHEALAFALLEQETLPSWLYQVRRGATTIWETWDVVRADGRLRKGLSLNHYAFGAVGDWLYRHVAGVGPSAEGPGFRHVRIAPHPGGSLTHARARLRSPYGEVSSSWRIESGHLELEVVVPPNATASVRLPGARLGEVREGGAPLAEAEAVSTSRQSGDDVELEIGSGRYAFRHPYRTKWDQDRQSQGMAANSSSSNT